MSLEFFIAGRYLKAKRKEGFISVISFLSVAGVAVGVMALVIVIAVMSGAEKDFRKRILGVEPHILVMSYSGRVNDYQSALKQAEQIKGVVAISPMVFAQTMIRSSRSLAGAMVRGVDPQCGFSLIKGFTSKQLEKDLFPTGGNNALPGIILGKELAINIGALKGEKIVLISPSGMISPVGQIPSLKRFIVTGIFESGMYEYDSALAYVHIKEAQKLMGMKERVSALGVWVDDVFAADAVKKTIVSTLNYPFYAKDWMETNKSLFSALKLEKIAMFIILSLIILVAAFNIASALIMMVMEKTKDIAVLKAMGATDRIVRRIFVIKGMIIGLLGTFFGTVSGILACLLLKKYKFIELPAAYPFSALPIQLEYMDVFFISFSAVVICFVSTLYPSYRASKMDPVEALRYG
ncbi:MAG: lipoprotein-releasing ABC transporter permease subunit [Thermodesulfobacteriota bacterium]|nr:lipoprotein-releasing ABC transporter permease subunit [Thermodesulfobacteriota bacterium]